MPRRLYRVNVVTPAERRHYDVVANTADEAKIEAGWLYAQERPVGTQVDPVRAYVVGIESETRRWLPRVWRFRRLARSSRTADGDEHDADNSGQETHR